MKPPVRHATILELLREHRKVTVDFLSERLGTSRETIRRDLTELSLRGQLRKYHGGATLLDQQTEGAFRSRLLDQADEKRAVARCAAALFDRDDTLFIDTGTTTLAFAQELAARPAMTVVTNSLAITQTMARGGEGHRVFLIGGEYVDEASENVGRLAVEQISQFHARDAVITVGAIDASGVMDYELREAEIARAMIAQAKRVTVVADATKLNRTALFQVCTLERVDRLVINERPDAALSEALAAAGVEVIVVALERKNAA
ncbi:DeoR/GlpR family DNA-binding transcription regulator [Burkholderia cenocepacia]|uniref:DeoR/GlpR family DNA-binding transcription regulator n=1 Tax=Burkholderia cenocepacia TaxID=95486 RepID=UPI002863886C|nr:DeoR/GlpR family DNA-binding transcription regulator [Burkholderia cenocepacia]MDR5646539.1 DeoR/GlpR family DNA-binding transcription regulator [Burkholderia cenocepacia]